MSTNQQLNNLELNTNKISTIPADFFHKIWDFKLVSIEQNTITIGNIIIASIICILGLWYTKKLKAKLKSFLSQKFQEDQDLANAIENIVSYLSIIIFIIIIMQIANIPMSIFAFIGGALAISVGLGAQNLISNFIASLIIMIEKPIKIGDYIKIDNLEGLVTRIGTRCIVLETTNMNSVSIPNNVIINQSLVNWSNNIADSICLIKIKFYKTDFCKISKITNYAAADYNNISHKLLYEPEKILDHLNEVFQSFNEVELLEQPKIFLDDIDDHYFTFKLLFNCDKSKIPDNMNFKSCIYKTILKNFDATSIVIS
ncbi:MAG: mechanosensitive ion channel [Rickettsiaceae bacterium]|nr:mechanosensitive ion channel [Rickettsiaceae bacterium]